MTRSTNLFNLLPKLAILTVISFVLFMLYISTANAAPVTIDPDATPSIVVECDIPATLGDASNTPLPITDIAEISFEVSNTGQETWTPAGKVTNVTSSSACKQTYNIASSPDGTYWYRSTYTHVNGQISPFPEPLEVKLQRPLVLLPITNIRITPAQ
jgi:hypothetical protein